MFLEDDLEMNLSKRVKETLYYKLDNAEFVFVSFKTFKYEVLSVDQGSLYDEKNIILPFNVPKADGVIMKTSFSFDYIPEISRAVKLVTKFYYLYKKDPFDISIVDRASSREEFEKNFIRHIRENKYLTKRLKSLKSSGKAKEVKFKFKFSKYLTYFVTIKNSDFDTGNVLKFIEGLPSKKTPTTAISEYWLRNTNISSRNFITDYCYYQKINKILQRDLKKRIQSFRSTMKDVQKANIYDEKKLLKQYGLDQIKDTDICLFCKFDLEKNYKDVVCESCKNTFSGYKRALMDNRKAISYLNKNCSLIDITDPQEIFWVKDKFSLTLKRSRVLQSVKVR